MCNCDYVFLLLYVLFSTDSKLVAQYFAQPQKDNGCIVFLILILSLEPHNPIIPSVETKEGIVGVKILSQQVQWQTVISGVCCTHVAPGALCELICTLLSPIDLDRKSVSNGLGCTATRDALLQVQMCFPHEAQIMMNRKLVCMCR